MTSNKRVKSIARRINRSWSRKLLRAYLLIDLVVLALAIVGFCYAAERVAGDIPHDGVRSIVFADGAFDFLNARGASFFQHIVQWLDFPRWGEAISTAQYSFLQPNDGMTTLPMGDYLSYVAHMFSILLFIELIFWVWDRLFCRGTARRALKPLNQMTETAQHLSAASSDPDPYAADRLHNLEDAISSLAPELQGTRLATGNQELKGLEGAINNLLTRMQLAYRDQARFVSDASHELRTPIAVIQGYASMLDRWGKQDESILDESIAAIKSEADHMKALVEQLLFLARGDSGRQALELSSFDLAELMQEVLDEYELIDPSHHWSLLAPAPVFCYADEGLIKQVARILADNAIKYTAADGAVDLSVFQREGLLCFSVQDSGNGIPADAVPHIFERFYRADPARTGAPDANPVQSSGTGLGLSIAQWIVQRHRGYFEVLSKPGLGTRITVCLPKRQAPETENA